MNDLNEFMSILRMLADPKALTAKLDQLANRQAQMEEVTGLFKTVNDVNIYLRDQEDKLETWRSDLETKQGAFDKKKATVEATQAKEQQVLDAKAEELYKIQAEQQATERAQKAAADALTKQEADLDKKRNALLAKQAELDALQGALEDKSSKLKTLLAS